VHCQAFGPEADEVLGLKSGECGALVRLIEAREHVVRPEDRGERQQRRWQP
jgi:hypothetical protein